MALSKQEKISVTVFIFTYNHEKFIKKCIESVINQKTNFNIKVLIIDDKSTDNTTLIIKKLIKNKHNFQLISSKKNYGRGRLCLLKHHGNKVETDYFMSLDGDDYWTDIKKIKSQIMTLEKNKKFIGCGHFSNIVNENGKKIIGKIEVPISEVNRKDWFSNKYPVYMHTSSMMWRNIDGSIYSKILLFLKIYGDNYMYFDKLKYGNVGVIPKFMSDYRIHKNGIWSRLTKKEQNWQNKKMKIMIFILGLPYTIFYFLNRNYKI